MVFLFLICKLFFLVLVVVGEVIFLKDGCLE